MMKRILAAVLIIPLLFVYPKPPPAQAVVLEAAVILGTAALGAYVLNVAATKIYLEANPTDTSYSADATTGRLAVKAWAVNEMWQTATTKLLIGTPITLTIAGDKVKSILTSSTASTSYPLLASHITSRLTKQSGDIVLANDGITYQLGSIYYTEHYAYTDLSRRAEFDASWGVKIEKNTGGGVRTYRRSVWDYDTDHWQRDYFNVTISSVTPQTWPTIDTSGLGSIDWNDAARRAEANKMCLENLNDIVIKDTATPSASDIAPTYAAPAGQSLLDTYNQLLSESAAGTAEGAQAEADRLAAIVAANPTDMAAQTAASVAAQTAQAAQQAAVEAQQEVNQTDAVNTSPPGTLAAYGMDFDFPIRFSQFMTEMKGTSLFTLPNMLQGIPGGGSSVYEFDAGMFGHQSFNFNTMDGIFGVLRTVLMVLFAWFAVRIVTLKAKS